MGRVKETFNIKSSEKCIWRFGNRNYYLYETQYGDYTRKYYLIAVIFQFCYRFQKTVGLKEKQKSA
ncbi:hypothetical protein ANACAC_01442 [Anaerostipes caccae L1-92]|uniref:Uncharacterized protein n=1 Tax=Anaerostipes caccae (strain DSM 14662 / CCUG 47493 / JCM 13470 / NCIMB 13811 / L1-92) TaxID=411490 RepID=B0MD00_ANACD|nr:hypothetical protein ANACAC_01442 [Anaerostipes caccae L1-92]